MTARAPSRAPIVAVIGGSEASPADLENARRVGEELAGSGIIVLTGGRGGVMEAASRGAFEAGGLTLAILPGSGPEETAANPYVAVPVYTGLGDARNAVIARTAQALIAVGGGFGTLSEIGLALKAKRPVVLLGSWRLQSPAPMPELGRLLLTATDAAEAARLAIRLVSAPPAS
jgi:uncharacterized protein (TIGR00725 family)